MITETALSPKDIMEAMIDSAQITFLEAEKLEESHDYEDAMESMERTEADGYVNGLQSAYKVYFGDFYDCKVELPEEDDK